MYILSLEIVLRIWHHTSSIFSCPPGSSFRVLVIFFGSRLERALRLVNTLKPVRRHHQSLLPLQGCAARRRGVWEANDPEQTREIDRE